MKATLQQWADRINAPLGTAVASIFEIGRQLVAAKKALPHGEWEKLFQDHQQAVKCPVRFSVNTAQRLMTVAQHPILSKAAHAHLLPPSWYTLYELTKVKATLLTTALQDGRVRPDMERKDARALFPTLSDRNGYMPTDPTEILGHHTAALADSLHRFFKQWPPAEHQFFFTTIETTVKNIRRTKEG